MTGTLSTQTGGAIAKQRCVIVGAGGLGHPVVAGLMALGVGEWQIIDPDLVEPSNLHRQWLFGCADRHRFKAQVVAEWILARAPQAKVQVMRLALDLSAPLPWDPAPNELWFECSDSPALKFALSRTALARKIPCVIGGVLGWQGQVFAQAPQPGCYHCLFETPPNNQDCASCESAGVFTPVAAAVGHMMVARAARLVQERLVGRPSANTLWHADFRQHRHQELRAPIKRDCCHCRGLASDPAIG